VDLETIVIDDVFKLLQCDEEGLSQDEAKRRLELFGPNKLEAEEQNPFLQVSAVPVILFLLLTIPL
jgi:H+-transporting ATPase